jgi:hypothetical protein
MALLKRPYGPPTGNPSGVSTFTQNVAAVGTQQGVLPALQEITSATETVILNPLTVPLTIPLALTALLPPIVGLEQIPFDLSASGYIKTTAAGNVTLKLYAGSSTTVGSNTLLASSGAIAQATLVAPYWIHGKLIYDSVSGLLCGTAEFYVNKTLVAPVTLSNFVANINDTDDPVASFLLTLTSSGALVANPTTINVQAFTCG